MGWWPRIGLLRVSTAVTLAILFCAARGGALAVTQWDNLPYSVTMSQITGMGQASEGTKALVLEHDGACTIHASVSVGGTAVLTLGALGGPTLDTYYMLTGMADQDAAWLSTTDFLARIYSTPVGAGIENLTLHVRGVPPTNAAPAAGNYQAKIVLTVTF